MVIWKTGDRKPETGNRQPEAGSRKPEKRKRVAYRQAYPDKENLQFATGMSDKSVGASL